MRTKLLVIAAALLLASAGTTFAQDQAADAAFNQNVWASIGFSTSNVTGDRARFDRFSDLRKNGMALDLFGEKTTPDLRVQWGGQHVGYDDQALFASVNAGGKVKATVSFTGQPLNYGFKVDGYVQTLVRRRLQAGLRDAGGGTERNRHCHSGQPRPADVVPGLLPPDRHEVAAEHDRREVRVLADRAGGPVVPREDVHAAGDAALGRVVGFSQAVEIAAPVDNRTADVEGKLEWGTSTGP